MNITMIAMIYFLFVEHSVFMGIYVLFVSLDCGDSNVLDFLHAPIIFRVITFARTTYCKIGFLNIISVIFHLV